MFRRSPGQRDVEVDRFERGGYIARLSDDEGVGIHGVRRDVKPHDPCLPCGGRKFTIVLFQNFQHQAVSQIRRYSIFGADTASLENLKPRLSR